jgi:uncharacterized protein (DUF2062 family)
VKLLETVSSFLKQRIIQPVHNLLKQGMTPEKLGATIAVGAITGVIPFLGVTTILGTAIAARFRLNIAATVLIGYLVQPLQLLLAIPFIKLGILIFGLDSFRLSFVEMQTLFKMDWVNALNILWRANLAGVAAWAIVSVPIGWIMYAGLVPILKIMLPKTKSILVEPLIEDGVLIE